MFQKRISTINTFFLLLCFIFIFLFGVTLNQIKITEKNFFLTADFSVFYVTAQGVVNGKDMYNRKNFAKKIAAERGAKGSVRYLYAPLSIIIFFPLLFFTHDTAAILWGIINIALIAGGMICTLFLIQKQRSLKHYTIYMGMLVFFGPLYQAIMTGQVNILIATLLLCYLLSLERKNIWNAGIFLACIIWLKIFPVALLFYHLVKKQWKIFFTTSVVLIVLLFFSFGLFGFETHKNFLRVASSVTTKGIHSDTLGRKSNATLNGVLHTYYMKNATTQDDLTKKEKNITLIRYSIIFLIGFLLLLWTYTNKKYKGKETFFIEVGAWISFVFFAAADMHIQYFVLLLPFFFIYLTHTPAFRQKIPRILLGLSYIFIALSETSLIHVSSKEMPFSLGFVGNTLFLITIIFYSYHFQKKYGDKIIQQNKLLS